MQILSDLIEIIPVKGLQAAFQGYLDRKGSRNTITPKQDSEEDHLEILALKGPPYRKVGDSQTVTKYCIELTTKNLI